jgi:argininosuccinate synthase
MQRSPLGGHRTAVLVSGGLSSLALAAWLHGHGHAVTAFAADLGHAGRPDQDGLAADLRAAGIPVVETDLRLPMAETALETVGFLADYDGGYWNTTGLSRAVLVRGLAPQAREAGCAVLATGCVSGGNDQRRFERYTNHFAPDLGILAPWSDPQVRAALPDRAAMARYLDQAGLRPLPGNTVEHSIEGNLAGVSHEDAVLEDLSSTPAGLARMMGVAPQDAPDTVRSVVIGIEHGRPVSIDGRRLGPVDLLGEANLIGGRNGLGLTDVVENRANGTKCRGVYEAPGLQLLAHAVRAAYEAVTGRALAETVGYLSRRLAVAVYEGEAYGPAATAARAGLQPVVDLVTATVRLDVYKGGVIGRSLLDFNRGAGVVQQRRFDAGGHLWNSAPISVHAEPPAGGGPVSAGAHQIPVHSEPEEATVHA